MKKLKIYHLVFTLAFAVIFLLSSGCSIQLFPEVTSTQTTAAQPPASTSSPIPTWSPPPTTTASQILPDFASVVAKVRPSVVAINTEVVTFDVFNRQYTEQGAGSGWVMDENGLIATNNHVIDGAKTITVTLADGTALPASVVGTDILSDLAVLKVEKTGLPALQLGDSSNAKIGEWVVAIGNALGEGISATEGIISRTGASISVDSGQTLSDLLQTSAAINPGNSGGPLVNMKGEVIGITSAKLSAVGVEGMGYAISTKTALPTFEALVQKGYVIRPYMGVQLATVDQWLIFTYRLKVNQGAFLSKIVSGGPADKAGLKAGDVIVAMDGKDIVTADDAMRLIRTAQIGQKMEITYWRADNKSTTQVTLVESPAP